MKVSPTIAALKKSLSLLKNVSFMSTKSSYTKPLNPNIILSLSYLVIEDNSSPGLVPEIGVLQGVHRFFVVVVV